MHPRPAVNPRLLALLGVVAVAVLVPLAGASAGPVLHDSVRDDAVRHDAARDDSARDDSARDDAARDDSAHHDAAHHDSARSDDAKRPGLPPSPPPSRPAAAPPSRPQDKPRDAVAPARPAHDAAPPRETTARCGPELSSPHGVEAQTCVLSQAGDTWARTYYRNATGEALKAVLSVMGPKGRTVQMHCAVGADDEPAVCETPRERTAGTAARYTAVAEFARAGGAALLLRSGSN
ncbi:hypothetical protein [Streptomyces flavofungini]|uniref:hypothetical protein n=1 Tax=Streptomyces flavofungini TaxID=68200 RepID=UPI0025AF5CF7|nr:hypothetical protein [Streptomyces flavofungini]WJV47621.1 hypothetical protein QUY26_20070 [Streptomyces flavofungini]